MDPNRDRITLESTKQEIIIIIIIILRHASCPVKSSSTIGCIILAGSLPLPLGREKTLALSKIAVMVGLFEDFGTARPWSFPAVGILV